jgi:hypothetical protein
MTCCVSGLGFPTAVYSSALCCTIIEAIEACYVHSAVRAAVKLLLACILVPCSCATVLELSKLMNSLWNTHSSAFEVCVKMQDSC